MPPLRALTESEQVLVDLVSKLDDEGFAAWSKTCQADPNVDAALVYMHEVARRAYGGVLPRAIARYR